MATDDIRTRRLEWIRDGSVWLVGLSGGALVLSATYFFDKFAQQPRASGLLFGSWFFLLVAAGAGIFTAFSTWKDLTPAPQAANGEPLAEVPLGGWVANCYTAMMWSFLVGFILLVIALIINVAVPQRRSDVQKIEITVPSGVTIQIVAPQEKNPVKRGPFSHAVEPPIGPSPSRTTS